MRGAWLMFTSPVFLGASRCQRMAARDRCGAVRVVRGQLRRRPALRGRTVGRRPGLFGMGGAPRAACVIVSSRQLIVNVESALGSCAMSGGWEMAHPNPLAGALGIRVVLRVALRGVVHCLRYIAVI